MNRTDAAVCILVVVLATGEVHVAHLPEAFYLQPPAGIGFAQVTTATGAVNAAWGVRNRVTPT